MPVMQHHPRRSGARRRVLAALAMALVLAGLGTAGASERGKAERLYTKGLAELHAGRKDAAVALFEQARIADPADLHGLYYLGLGYGHLGRYQEAVDALKTVVAAADPSIDRDHLELAYALFRVKRFDDAAAELQIAVQRERSAGEATLLLAMVESSRGNRDAAASALTRAGALDPSNRLAVRYYQGMAAYRAGDDDAAGGLLSWVRDNGGNNPLAREAGDVLQRIDRGGSNRRYRLHAGFALEYDSNVAIAPDDDNIAMNLYGIRDKADGRAVFNAGAKYALYSSPAVRVAVGYGFLQSLHFDLNKYDVQNHKITVDSEYIRGPAILGLSTAFEHSLLDGESLYSGESVQPWLRINEGDVFGRSEVYYRARNRNFLLSPFSPVRDSWNHSVGVRQYVPLGAADRTLVLGYRYDRDVAHKNIGLPYNYDGNQFEVGVNWVFPWDISLETLYAYKLENYSKASRNRDDDKHQLGARVEKRLTDLVWLTGTYTYRRNLSDQVSFEYARHITALGIEVRY